MASHPLARTDATARIIIVSADEALVALLEEAFRALRFAARWTRFTTAQAARRYLTVRVADTRHAADVPDLLVVDGIPDDEHAGELVRFAVEDPALGATPCVLIGDDVGDGWDRPGTWDGCLALAERLGLLLRLPYVASR